MTAVEWFVKEIAMKNNDINFDFDTILNILTFLHTPPRLEMEFYKILLFYSCFKFSIDFNSKAC